MRTDYYEIQAADEASLLAALHAQGPSHARSSWKLAYEYAKREAPGRCSVSGVATKLELAITLPRWAMADAASPALRERWSRYVQALAAHEEKRLEHARELERALGNALAVLPPATDCAALDAAANARYEALAALAREKDTDYDARARRREIPLPAF